MPAAAGKRPDEDNPDSLKSVAFAIFDGRGLERLRCRPLEKIAVDDQSCVALHSAGRQARFDEPEGAEVRRATPVGRGANRGKPRLRPPAKLILLPPAGCQALLHVRRNRLVQ